MVDGIYVTNADIIKGVITSNDEMMHLNLITQYPEMHLNYPIFLPTTTTNFWNQNYIFKIEVI